MSKSLKRRIREEHRVIDLRGLEWEEVSLSALKGLKTQATILKQVEVVAACTEVLSRMWHYDARQTFNKKRHLLCSAR